MQYVEVLRARRVLTWYCGILLAAVAVVVFSIYSAHGIQGQVNGTERLSELLKVCAFGAMVVATCVAPGLNAESNTIAIIWTRPSSRDAIAWRYIAVDVLTIVFAYAFLAVLGVAVAAIFGALNSIVVDAAVPIVVLNGIGCALMWYGLVTVVTARMDGRGGLISGLSWGAFIVAGGLWAVPFPPLLHNVLTVLNYFNPLTYVLNIGRGSEEPGRMSVTTSTNGHVATHTAQAHTHILNLSPELLTLIAWCFVAVTLVATVRLWSTREV